MLHLQVHFYQIKPELINNIFMFGYGVNYKYEGMLAHSFDRFYIVINLFSPQQMIYTFQNLIWNVIVNI